MADKDLGKANQPDPYELKAARTFAACWNDLNPTSLELLVADDIIYESQNVFSALTSKKEVMEYLYGKMETVRKSDGKYQVFAELGEVCEYPGFYPSVLSEPCVLLAQGSRDDIGVLILFKMRDGKIARIDLCTVAPNPLSARRTGIYPKISDL